MPARHRCFSPCSAASSTARWWAELGAHRPARSLDQEGVSAADGVRPHKRGTRSFRTCRSDASLTSDPAALSLIDFAELPFFMALPFAAPPDIPIDRAKALQAAFMAMCRGQGASSTKPRSSAST